MESQGGEAAKKETEELTADFSKQTLKRIERASSEQQSAVALILDNNEIQRLDNLETYSNLKKLSLVNNQIIRMYGVSHLVHLETLDLSNNSLVTIEGLKDLKELKTLNLAKNRIKNIEHLSSNLKLEKIDLSENNIMRISDISYLENLKELNLHGNRINHLTQCEKKLPISLEVLTLNNNSIADLNEISHLVNLISLKELSIVNNPCLDFSEDQKFNYRPFIKNWCSSLIILDNCPLDDIECLKAEWLYSQGRGRSFRPGEHAALLEYLVSVCPKEGEENIETEDVKKLRLILSKAQLHQKQLREQLTSGKFTFAEAYKSSVLTKKASGIPERMVTSFQDPSSKDFRHSPELMTRSLDSGMMRKSSKISKQELNQNPLQTSTTFIPIPDTLISPDVVHSVGTNYPRPSSLSSRTSHSSARNSPHSTPESKRKTPSTSVLRRQDENTSFIAIKRQEKVNYSRSSTPLELLTSIGKSASPRNIGSPGKRAVRSRGSEKNCRETSEEEDNEVLAIKLKPVHMRANQKKQNKMQQKDKKKGNAEERFKEKPKNLKDLRDSEAWRAAVCIQRRWRGYRARNLNGEVLTGCKSIQMNRMQDYITKVVRDMEATRIALEGNKKLVVLQMQAINALWKKMTALQPAVGSQSNENNVNLQDLIETCSVLNKQVEGLQAMMKAMQASSALGPLIPMATQTEIVAVHTPQGEGREIFPYKSKFKLQSGEDLYSTDSVEGDERHFQEKIIESDNGSTTGTIKTVRELYINCSLNDKSEVSSLSESLDEKSVTFLSEKLTKPSVKLSENNTEVPVSSPEETENLKEKAEFQDPCNS